MNKLIEMLTELCAIDGISGDEGRVAEYICYAAKDAG